MAYTTNVGAGKLSLEATVVGRSKFNESVQKLKNGQVAGQVSLSLFTDID